MSIGRRRSAANCGPRTDRETHDRRRCDCADRAPAAGLPFGDRRRLSPNDADSNQARPHDYRPRRSDAAPVAMINEEAARRFWPGRDPVGARIALGATGQRPGWRSSAWSPTCATPTSISPVAAGLRSLSAVSERRFRGGLKSASADPLQLVPADPHAGRGHRSQSAHSQRRIDVVGAVRRSWPARTSWHDPHHDRPHRSVSVGGGYLRSGVVLGGVAPP